MDKAKMGTRGSAETIELLKALLACYPTQLAAAQESHYSSSYLSLLSTGQRIASINFCHWVKVAHPELKLLCTEVLFSKIMD